MNRILLVIFVLITFSSDAQSYLEEFKSLKKQYSTLVKAGQLDSAEVIATKMLSTTSSDSGSYYYAEALEILGKAQYKNLKHIEALDNLHHAKNIYIELDSLASVLACNYFIGRMYEYELDYDNALFYYHHGLEISEKLDIDWRICKWHNAIANMHLRKGNYDKAMTHERTALKYGVKSGRKDITSYVYSTIGEIFYHKGEMDSALHYMSTSLDIKIEEDMAIAWLYSKIGKVHNELGNYSKAIDYCLTGYKSEQGENSPGELYCLECLVTAYSGQNNFEKAFVTLKQYDSLHAKREGVATYKAMARAAYSDLYDEKVQSDSINLIASKKASAAALRLKDEQLNHENEVKIYLYVVIGLSLASLLFILSRLNLIRRQRNLITEQRDHAEELKKLSDIQRAMVEEKNKEITDSINYAKRIQSAILPPHNVIKQHLPNSFVLYKPKDIVAGDFYWLEPFADAVDSDGTKNGVLFAAADCTGHGVPGAMVSVVCNNGLNRAVRELGLVNPAKILDKTRQIVIEEFEKSDENVKDGMDIALCSISGNTLHYSGAHNPLWIFRGDECIEIKADKQPIGKYENPTPFTVHSIELLKGDMIYLFTDGYSDQFGGDKGKKMKAKNFKTLLQSIKDKSIDEQKFAIDTAFEEWKGKFEQLDDVCVFGVRF